MENLDEQIRKDFEMTMRTMSQRNAVDGFDPRLVTACYQDANGEKRMYLQAEPAMQWFYLKHPHGRLEQVVTRIDSKSATMEGRVYDDAGNLIANAFVTRYYSDADSYGKDYIQNAGTSAIRKALGNCGFGTPADAQYIQGITPLYESGQAPEMPVDNGKEVNRTPPPAPKHRKQRASTKQSENDILPIEPAKQQNEGKAQAKTAAQPAAVATNPATDNVPVNEKQAPAASAEKTPAQPVPVEPAVQKRPPVAPPPIQKEPTTLDEALAFRVPVGRFAGKTMKELVEASENDAIRYYLRPSYTGKPIQTAARMVAGQYGL